MARLDQIFIVTFHAIARLSVFCPLVHHTLSAAQEPSDGQRKPGASGFGDACHLIFRMHTVFGERPHLEGTQDLRQV